MQQIKLQEEKPKHKEQIIMLKRQSKMAHQNVSKGKNFLFCTPVKGTPEKSSLDQMISFLCYT